MHLLKILFNFIIKKLKIKNIKKYNKKIINKNILLKSNIKIIWI